MVDYYIYDKNNPLLLRNEFEAYGVTSGRWAQFYNCKIDNLHEFHHDYAIWETMRSAFNYCKFLNKKYIHFFEYDNNPDLLQYRQSFLERIHEHDAIIYEYHPNSIDDTLLPFCATYMFSIKTDIAIDVIDLVKSKKEYFSDRPNGWQLERIFLYYLKQKTNNILKTSYVANNNELNTQAVWNRDGVDRNGAKFQAYLAVDKDKLLYIHLVSGFHGRRTDCDYLIEINYEDYHRFYYLKKDDMMVEPIGVYNKGSRVKIYHEGVEVFNEYLGKEYEEFYKLNNIIFNSTKKPNPKSINLNFVDGAYVHIDDDNDVDYKIDFIDKKSQKLIYSTNVKGTWWSRTSKIYYTDWLIKITGNEFKYAYNLDLKDKRVLISFESKSLGDNLAWIPYVEKFREKHNCKIICSTFHNKMFKDQYQEIEFVEPGTVVNDLHAQYRIGLFKKDGKVDYDRHPENPLKVPLTKIASDILGLDYEELKPRIKNYAEYKRKTVTIAVHSTAQCKYWNNPNGWQDIVDYLKANGYEVILLSREEDGYMGNKNPSGVIQHPPGDIEKVIKVIQESTFFIGLSSGLSWLAWACNIPTVLISGFTDDDLEPKNGIIRVINKNVCNGCWSRHDFDAGDWNWCPDHKGTSRQFECSKEITSEMVIEKIKDII
jgi:autotransporter strand-loop-strand O-heptosyltransferase